MLHADGNGNIGERIFNLIRAANNATGNYVFGGDGSHALIRGAFSNAVEGHGDYRDRVSTWALTMLTLGRPQADVDSIKEMIQNMGTTMAEIQKNFGNQNTEVQTAFGQLQERLTAQSWRTTLEYKKAASALTNIQKNVGKVREDHLDYAIANEAFQDNINQLEVALGVQDPGVNTMCAALRRALCAENIQIITINNTVELPNIELPD